jgi:transposase
MLYCTVLYAVMTPFDGLLFCQDHRTTDGSVTNSYVLCSLHAITMAPRLAASQHDMIRDMIVSESIGTVDMAAAADCSDRTVRNIRSNMRCFGSSRAPFNGGGRRRQITPVMLDALKERLLEKPGMYQDEMALFLYDEFEILVNNSAVSRALASIGWTKKATRQIAKERNADLRDYYLHNLSAFQSHHLVYVDESGCDKRIGFRRTGWSPLGVAPVQVAQFHRDRRHQILPAYTQEGVLFIAYFRAQRTAPSSKTSSNSFSSIADVGQNRNRCLSWTTPRSTTVRESRTCALTQASSLCSCRPTRQI